MRVMARGKNNLPSNNWPIWKVLILVPIPLGGFAALLAFVPSYSPQALAVGIGLTVVGVVAAVWISISRSWWAAMVFINSWLLLMLGVAIRAWAKVIPQVWLWLVPLVAAYLLAWALPAISPKLSARLLREQLAPETRWGRGCLTLFLVAGPAAGALGASVGMYGSRFGQGTAVIIVIAVLFSAVSVGFAQAVAEQSWPKRPWAQHSDSGLKDAAR